MSTRASPSNLFKLSFPTMAKIVCGLPLFGMTFCVVWSVLFDFDASTRTHCRVPNYLPSISSAIGGFTPQRYVWRVCIALHATPRFMIAVAYYNFHTSVHVGKKNELFKSLAAVASFCNILEVASLVGLSFISSTENHGVHEMMFITFMIFSLVYMLLTILLFSWGRGSKGSWMSNEETKSLAWKKIYFLTNISVFLFSVYIFFRHNWYCEPGVYTGFAVCEYIVILTNVGFHGTASIDFSPFSLAYARTNLIFDRPSPTSAEGNRSKHS